MGVVPITAGPTVPIVVIDSPTLQAVPGDRWVAPLYLTNNSGADANAQIGCTFTNASRPVQETRIIAPTAGPGQRLAFAAYGPRSTSSSTACSAACSRPDRGYRLEQRKRAGLRPVSLWLNRATLPAAE